MGFSPWRPLWPPSLKPRLQLPPIPTTTEATAWDTVDTVPGPTDTVLEVTTADTVATTASVRLRLSPRLPLPPIPTTTEATAWGLTATLGSDTATAVLEVTTVDTVDTTASVRLRLSPRLRLLLPLIPTTTEAMA